MQSYDAQIKYQLIQDLQLTWACVQDLLEFIPNVAAHVADPLVAVRW